MTRLIPPLAALLISASPVTAGETPWQEIAPGVTMRLISNDVVTPQGSILVALEIDMPEDTKTYWRVPGDTGFPAELVFSGTAAVERHNVLWPYPVREDKGTYLDYAYFGHTVLPIELTIGNASGAIELSSILGICSDICIPAQAAFSLGIDAGSPDRTNGLRIRQAMAEVPLAWPDEEGPFGKVSLAADANGISVELLDPSISSESLIVATEDGTPLFGTPQKSPQENLVVLPIVGKTENSALEGTTVQITFMTDMGPYALDRVVEPMAAGQ